MSLDAETIKKLRGLIQDLVYAELDDALSCTNGGAPSSDRQRELEDDRSKARKAVHDHLSDIEAALDTQSSRTEARGSATYDEVIAELQKGVAVRNKDDGSNGWEYDVESTNKLMHLAAIYIENMATHVRALSTCSPGEPVAWRVRVKSADPEEWSLLPAGGGADYLNREDYECQPLYSRGGHNAV